MNIELIAAAFDGVVPRANGLPRRPRDLLAPAAWVARGCAALATRPALRRLAQS